MALDFPANPTDGEVFGSYVWSASKGVWQSREESAAPAVVSSVPPTTSNPGDIWVDSSDGTAYVRYDDGSSGQWIEMISSGVPSLASKADKTYVDSQDLLKANLSGATFTGNVNVGSSGTLINASNGTASFTSSDSGKSVVTVQGATSQSATLQEWRNSSGTAKSWIDSSGRFFAVDTGSGSTVALSNEIGGVSIRSTSTTAASMSFHVPGLIATNVGVQPDQRFSIGGWSLPVDSFSIDTGGRVRKPFQPSFTATRNDNGSNVAVGDYIFDKVWHNTGGHYSSANGRFTAPVAGRYLFISQFQLWGTAGGALGNSYFRKNGSQYPSASSSEGVQGMLNKPGDSGWHANLAVTAIIDLAANDYVTVYQSGVRGMQSHFSGYLLG
jgi:hypothetical protein